MDTSLLINHMVRAARFDIGFYKEAEADESLNQEALLIVIIVAIAGGIGSFFGGILGNGIIASLIGLFVVTILTVASYYLWAYITLWVGTHMYEGISDIGAVKRTLGYAMSPRVLVILGFIPCVGPLIAFAAGLWSLAAAIFATRQTMDLNTTHAIVSVIVGWIVTTLLLLFVGIFVGS